MSYTAHVRFSREAGDDAEIVERKPEFFGMTYRRAFEKQLAAELQEAYDNSDGALAGHFEVIAIQSDHEKTEKFLNTRVGDEAPPMKKALLTIKHARDHHAEHGEYPEGTVGKDQCFDDWAADLAGKALAEE